MRSFELVRKNIVTTVAGTSVGRRPAAVATNALRPIQASASYPAGIAGKRDLRACRLIARRLCASRRVRMSRVYGFCRVSW
jgi:hypothetical protein